MIMILPICHKSVRLLNEIDKNNWESILNEKFSNYIDLENDELYNEFKKRSMGSNEF